MPTLYAEIEISASRAAVWHALVHKENWLRWNTFLYDRDPNLAFQQGRTVQLSLRRLREETETEFAARVLLLQPEACLRWVSTAPGFRSEHVFELQDVGHYRVKYIHRELFSGPVTPFFLSFLRQDEQQGIRRMARELKLYLEGR